MANQFIIRNLSDHTLKVLDDEAARNHISRNALLQIVIENFANNLEQANATEILLEPLQDVTKQLNTLTHVTTESQHAISYDLTALKNSIEQLIKYMYDDTIG
ncbi:hypothetical protein G9403_04335 [Weissella paramesenteroides]|uniref:Ribbon-helix-helix protein, CopG family n=1 Tax=Weissella paramesenteroides TaxID=1249 RepID=A0ABD4XHV3_WEIPA|nr:hypothetical protein [Weissella paramesenteroides]MDF8368718.1 hypothetical protein [Weissella paramesenteroides]MDF8370889.1 hypothetical protein [Weissella paramesenteroides]